MSMVCFVVPRYFLLATGTFAGIVVGEGCGIDDVRVIDNSIVSMILLDSTDIMPSH